MPSDAPSRRFSRRRFLQLAASVMSGFFTVGARSDGRRVCQVPSPGSRIVTPGSPGKPVTLFLCGDVMLGRGIDQIMPVSAPTRLYEPFLTDARQYIRLAEAVNGPIPRPVDASYVWGDALAELSAMAPAARIINLETAVTAQGEPWRDKGIHYRLHPANISLLRAADVDCCVLANNHVLDWGYTGLQETLSTLDGAGIRYAGCGPDSTSAGAPAVLAVGSDSRILVFGLASATSGVPPAWQAGSDRAGVNLIDDDVDRTVRSVVDRVGRKRPGDIVVVSIHWGGNWGYRIPASQSELARALIDSGFVDVVHGHSSHHPKGVEVHRDRLILYGCGDLLNDYEGIRGHEEYRSDLSLMFFPTLDAVSGRLLGLALTPMRISRFRLRRAVGPDARWLRDSLNSQGRSLGTRFRLDRRGRLALEPAGQPV